MTLYWLIYSLWVAGAIQYTRGRLEKNGRILFAIAACLTALFVGLRYEVGGDWRAYQEIYETIYWQPLGISLTLSDPGYAALNWLFAQANIDVWAVNLVCGVLFMAGTARLASRQPNPWLAIVVAVPYLVIVVAMGYTRQAAAIGIISYGVADADERKVIKLVGYVAVAALFHKTAVLMLPFILAPIMTRNLLAGVFGTLVFAAMFLLVLGGASDRLVASYAQSNYDSQGATIRIAMNVLAGTVMLALRGRMGFEPYARSFWTYNALLALISVPALLLLPGSAGVDRLSLFLIPLQLVVLSRLPYAFSDRSLRPSVVLILGVVAYTFAVQFVWLNYATNASSWLPYSPVFAPAE